MIWYDPSWPFHVSLQQVRCSSGRKFRPICILVRRLRDLSSEATERLPRSNGYKNHPVHSRWPTSRNKIRRNHRKNHHENTLKKPGFEGAFFSVQSLSSILHFCAFLVARSGHSGFEWFWDAWNEPSQNQAFSCLPTTRGYVCNWIILNLTPCVIWYMKMIEQYWTCVF